MIPVFLTSCTNISTVKSFLIFEVPVNTQHYFFLSSSSSSTSCRYRSITKQFFRKADGVVVMYDITAQQSFTAVRQWLTSVKVRQLQSRCAAHISQNYRTNVFLFEFCVPVQLLLVFDSRQQKLYKKKLK